MNKPAVDPSRAHAPVPVEDQILGDDTIPSTPYTPRQLPPPPPSGAAAAASTIRRRAVGDRAGEHLYMKRGRFSAWPHVVVAFIAQTALAGALCSAPVWLAGNALLAQDVAGVLAFVVFAATGPAAGYLTF